MTAERKYPIGIQTFERVVRGGYLYVDKTDLVWQLAHYAPFVFLSRPRRFGKSLLSSTLHSYFAGQKELFEGLKIMDLEQEWECYPVLHFDLSGAKHMPVKGVREELERLLREMEKTYGRDTGETTPGMRFAGLVNRAYEQTGRQVAVIIDEYDAPLLDVLHEDGALKDMREVMQEFYQRLKMLEPKIKFCFITGITRISQLNIFSTLNNLTNVSLLPDFSAICGITAEELNTLLHDDISLMAKAYGTTADDMANRLKRRYDGYHFSHDCADIYNPYSLLSAFANKRVSNYWFETGTPTFLIRMMKHFRFDITGMDGIEATDYSISRPTEAMTTVIPLLYQAGYLTIKDYDREADIYTLSVPNEEVRIGYADGLLPVYVGLEGEDVQAGFALKFWRALKKDDIRQALEEMKAYLAGIPYVEGFKKKLEDPARAEGFYEYTMYLIFSMLNVYARTQVKCAKGRADIVVWMPNAIYVMELKVSDTAESALRQIDKNGYARPFATDGRKIVKVGIKFSPETMTVEDWAISE